MRGLILGVLMGSVGIAAAADPFGLDHAQIEQAIKERARAQDEWTAKAGSFRTLSTKGFDIQTMDLGLELRSGQYQRVESFLMDRGGEMSAITHQTGWEVCARVCVSQDGFLGLRVQTLGAALACHAGNQAADCPTDMIPTSVVVHTHGAGSIVQTTQADSRMGHDEGFAWIENANMPSPEDLAGEAGWLLAPNGGVVGYGRHPDWMGGDKAGLAIGQGQR